MIRLELLLPRQFMNQTFLFAAQGKEAEAKAKKAVKKKAQKVKREWEREVKLICIY